MATDFFVVAPYASSSTTNPQVVVPCPPLSTTNRRDVVSYSLFVPTYLDVLAHPGARVVDKLSIPATYLSFDADNPGARGTDRSIRRHVTRESTTNASSVDPNLGESTPKSSVVSTT